MRQRGLHPFAAVLLLVHLLGCGSVPKIMYTGPNRPLTEISMVWSACPIRRGPQIYAKPTNIEFDGVLNILEVDGNPTKSSPMQDPPYMVYVSPGAHTFKVQYTRIVGFESGGIEYNNSTAVVAANVEAGLSYVIDIEILLKDLIRFFIRPQNENDRRGWRKEGMSWI